MYLSIEVRGRRLEAHGHEVRALDQEPALEGIDDEEVLTTTAAAEHRILVTHNVCDFPPSFASGARRSTPTPA
jgi:hypothetical protein